MVVNKIDRPSARPDWVVEQVFDLFDSLGATDDQLDFPIVYASALNGVAGLEHENLADNMDAVFQAIVDHVPAPSVDREGPSRCKYPSLITAALRNWYWPHRPRQDQSQLAGDCHWR